MVNYKELEQAIVLRNEYTHGSSYARWENDYYNIYSYSTLIARITIDGGVAFWNGEYYSQTTSRLQNIIKRNYPEIERVMA